MTPPKVPSLPDFSHEDTEAVLGDASEDDPDEVISDFRSEDDPDELPDDECDEDEDEDVDDTEDVKVDTKIRVLKVPNEVLGRDGKFKWSGEDKKRTVRIAQRNIVLHPPGVLGAAKKVTTPLEAWDLYFHDVLPVILKHTNEEIARQRVKYKPDRSPKEEDENEEGVETKIRPSFVRDMNMKELRALIGLYYLAGVYKASNVNTRELFNTKPGFGIGHFRATMSESRFRFLTNCLRFDDKNTRNERKKKDPKLAAFRDVFDALVSKCSKLYRPSDVCTVDEQLQGFRGRCPFRIYLPSKPDRYGIKVMMLCDAKSFYIIMNAEIYEGKGSKQRGFRTLAEYYLLGNLTKPILGGNRTICCDNWFTSIPAAQELLKKGTTIVGTLRKNKKEIPASFVDMKNREPKTSIFAHHDELMLLSYMPQKKKKKKFVLLLSTTHDLPDKDEDVTLPDMIEFYNKNKIGVDTFDQMCATYSTSRKTQRWPLCSFYGMLDIIGINARVILKSLNQPFGKQPRSEFLKELVLSLINPFQEERLTYPKLSSDLKTNVQKILRKRELPDDFDEPEAPRAKKDCQSIGRCVICPRSADKKSRTKCCRCHCFICHEHQKKTVVCPNCENCQFETED